VKNFISDNDGIGLFIRDKSWGTIKGNTVTNSFKIRLRAMKSNWWWRGKTTISAKSFQTTKSQGILDCLKNLHVQYSEKNIYQNETHNKSN